MVRYVFHRFFDNIFMMVRGRPLAWYAGAITLTAVLVLSGIDWRFYELTRSAYFHPLVWVAGIGGFFAPVLIPLAVYLYGDFRSEKKYMQLGAAMGQAALLAYCASIILKAFTGRAEPAFLYTQALIDNSRNFHFGFLEYGVFWGWPSSHAAVAFAGAFVILTLTHNRLARGLAITYATFIGLGAAIGFHWLSDVLAGAIIGSVVGRIVARSFATAQFRIE